MTIQERAEQFARFDADCYRCCVYKDKKESLKLCPCKKFRDSYNLFLRIATEQREIDFQRAVEWLKLNVSEYLLVNFYGEKYIETDYLTKEFEQAMKGGNQ